MKVRNLRPWAVELCPPDGRVFDVEAGGQIDVDDELAARLLEQHDNWAAVAVPAPAPAPDTKDADK